MKILHDIFSWQMERKSILNNEKTLGVIMTMGALHQGHLSLIERSQKDNDITLVTIFVNPTQFNNQSDFINYPNTWPEDVKLLKSKSIDFLLAPSREILYPDRYQYQVKENLLSHKLCGSTRPGHFEGVLTIVLKLLNIIQPNVAYFGEKDYQQLQLIRKMTKAFFIPTKIIGCPTIRESDNLPYSSRNSRLNKKARSKATEFAKIIREKCDIEAIKSSLKKHGIDVDYLEDLDDRRFAAVIIDKIRLIDNFPLSDINNIQENK